MAKNYEKLSLDIIDVVGGYQNISNVTCCMTRLRISLIDKTQFNLNKAKEVPGVLNVIIKDNEYQFVIGQDVINLYKQFNKNTLITTSAPLNILADKTELKNNLFKQIFAFIGSVFSPVIPVLVAGGLTGAVMTILTTYCGLSSESSTYQIFYAINQAAFYFLPIFVGYSVATQLKINGYLGAFLASILLFDKINGVEGLNFFGVNIPKISYNSNVFPIILGVLFMALVYKLLLKYTPNILKTILVPLLTILISLPITLICLAPIGNYVGTLLADGLLKLYYLVPSLSVAIVGATTCWLVFFGMNNACYVPLFLLMERLGNDPLICTGMAPANVAVGGACLAVALISKSAEDKSISISASFSALCGISEPGVYGVLFVKKYPLIGAMIGGGIGGFMAGILNMTQYVISTPGFISFAAYITPTSQGGGNYNLIVSLFVMILALVVSFISTLLLGKYLTRC